MKRREKNNPRKGAAIPPAPRQEAADTIRLNRYVANAGVCSRREADQLIAEGLVTVNGNVVTEMGYKVRPEDEVRYNGKRLQTEKKVYVLLNKPRGFVTTVDDPHAEKTVMHLVREACPERIYPVGRLDKDTSGVLLFTNDGEMARKLTHPSFEQKKIYHVHVNGELTENDLDKLRRGIELEDGFIKADKVSFVDSADHKQVGIEIHSGKNRIVRRMFAHLGFTVIRLDRVFFAGLTKKNLPRGRWRFLTGQEISVLQML